MGDRRPHDRGPAERVANSRPCNHLRVHSPDSPNTSYTVLKCILTTLGKISGPNRPTRVRAVALTFSETPFGNDTPNSLPLRSSQWTNRSRARIDAAATARSDSALVR